MSFAAIAGFRDYSDTTYTSSSVPWIIEIRFESQPFSSTDRYPLRIKPPKKRQRIPFYRPLFDQRWPQSIRPTCKAALAVRWQPSMGRVRINRTPL